MNKPSFVLLAALAAAACGGSIGVDPITRGADAPPADGTTAPGDEKAPEPVAPTTPYTGDVGTNDVSILYPLPSAGESKDFVRPTAAGVHGQLLPVEFFSTVVANDTLDQVVSAHESGFGTLALISVRLDHCSARKGPGTCTSEVRAVFQAMFEDAGNASALDGGVHVTYDVGEAELVVMMKQILTLRKAHGDLTSTRLEVHPILAQQGLGGGFAKGFRDILLEHAGAARIARITVFDHNFNPDSDGWTFSIFDNVDNTLTARKIRTLGFESQTVAGSSAVGGPFPMSGTFEFHSEAANSVAALVNTSRPEKGTQAAMDLYPVFQTALRVQNPTIHNAETTDCGNCHLAEGAHLIAENVYAMKANGAEFTAAGGTNYLLDRESVTNLHAFGYLARKVSIMQRTANESTVVRDWMDQKVK